MKTPKLLVNLVHELAVYEKLEHLAQRTRERLPPSPFRCQCRGPKRLSPEVAGKPVGFAIWFVFVLHVSGPRGIYLEDLFVRPDYRGLGIGKGFLAMLARLAVDRDYGRLEWSVLNWNSPASGFYGSLGAVPMNEWTSTDLTARRCKVWPRRRR